MKKRLLTAWIIACMFICLVGQTPIVALADGDDTRVISVPEGLQEVLNYDIPETQTVQTEDTTEDGEAQTGTEDENGEGQGEGTVGEAAEGQAANETAQDGQGEATQTTQDGDAQVGQSENAQANQGETVVGDAQNNQNAQGEGSVDEGFETQTAQGEESALQTDTTITTPENQTTSGDDTSVVTNDNQTVQNETIANGTSENQTVQEENAIEEILEDTETAQEITETNLTASIIASDGNTYETNVTYTSESGIPMEGVALKVTELVAEDEGYDEYLEESASKVGVDTEDILFSKVFDIKIVDANDENIEYEPTGNVDVSIRVVGVSLNEFENVNVLHFVEDKNDENYLVYDVETTVSEETVEFSTDSFSVYVIVAAPDPYAPIVEKAQTVQELNNNYYYLKITRDNSDVHYLLNTISSNEINATTKNVEVSSAARYLFELVSGETNKFYISTMVGGEKKYVKEGNLKFSLVNSSQEATQFTVELFSPNQNGYFKIYRETETNIWTLRGGSQRIQVGSADNYRSKFEFIKAIPDDYYGLDGKTYSITYYEEGIKGAGLTSTVSGNKMLATELLIRPDVLHTTGELLIAKDTDLPDWKFTLIEGSKYYITTVIGGVTYYLTLGSNPSLVTSPTNNSKINVESGTGDFAGKYKFTGPSNSLTLSGGKASNGFVDSTSGGQYSWLTLATKSALLEDDDFIVYSAETVNISDDTVVKNGYKVVLYTRKWNDSTKKYEYYAVNYDGSLVRAYETGDLIQWVGSTINTMEWEFTEYYDTDGNPNYYYQLKNTYPNESEGNCIRPSVDGSFLRTENAYPNYFDRSINLNGRRFGYYYSTILAWDSPSYAYIGLRVKDDCSGIEICPMSEADTFYFAIMKPTQQTIDSKIVETVDNKEYGITMKMVNFNSKEISPQGASTSTEQHDVMGLSTWSQNQAFQATKGLVSTNLVNGYPTAMETGKSLSLLFQSAVEVNHLFLKNTYFSSGYYEFDSSQNFASFYDKNGNFDSNYNFTVYEDLGTNDKKNSDSMKHGQFFPYNKLSNTYASVNPTNLYDTATKELPDSNPRKGEPLYLVADGTGNTGNKATDYYFGVEIEATFTQTPNGLDAWGHDIIYEFTGDDDFWLYVDGELVIDLGGIHSAIPGSVNYSTGEVNENGTPKTLYDIFYDNYLHRDNHTAAEARAYVDEIFEQNSNGQYVFKEYTDHTMHIFYMERGAGASNLHMKFNLASVKPGTVLLSKEIEGVDSMESYMSEYPFQIYYKHNEDDDETPLVPGAGTTIKVVYKDTNRPVTFYPSYTSLDGKIYYNVFILKPGETAEIDFPDDAVWYDICECAVDITEEDSSTNPPTTVHQGVYKEVKANGQTLNGQSNGQANSYRKDFRIGYAKVESRGRVTFQNVVDPNAKGTLTFVKHLYDESGNNRIYNADNDTTFTFRLYLGTEKTPVSELSPADMYSYHVRDNSDNGGNGGNYCYWDSTQGKLVSLGDGKYDFSQLSDNEKRRATFTTSMNGSIANIPVDYTVEIREMPAGTKYKVEERDYELPDGYSILWYVTKVESGSSIISSQSKEAATGVINVVSELNEIEIQNIKGWGLRCYKDWSDAAWMESRDAIYLAVYKDNNGTLVFYDNDENDTVRRVTRNEDSAYWFFESIDDFDGNNVKDNLDFEKYVVREVTISNNNPTVDSDTGKVTNYGTVTPLDIDGSGSVTLRGKQYGDSETDYDYRVTEYNQGGMLNNSNVRLDRITNKRAGVDLYITEWDGTTPLPGAVFSLKDGNGNNAVSSTLTSDSDGLITIAYMRNNEIYTLTEEASPNGFLGLQTPLYLKRIDDTVYVSNDKSTWETTVANSEDGWYFADDTDITSGDQIRIGKVTLKNKPYTLKIKKTQRRYDGSALPGATFALYRQVIGNDGQPRKDYQPIHTYDSLVTDADGFVPRITDDFEDGTLVSGTYYLHETYPVQGYQPLEEDVVFTISPTGKVTLDSCPTGVVLSQENIIFVPNQEEGTTELTIKKIVEYPTTANESANDINKFNFTVKLYLPDGKSTWPYSDVNGDFENGVASFSLGHNELKVLTVPLGAVAKVTEVPVKAFYDTSAAMDVTDPNKTTSSTLEFNSTNLMSTVTIKDDTGVTLTYTNTRKRVKVTVKKTVVGSGGDFRFTATLKDNNNLLCAGWTLSNNGTTVDTTDDIITGSDGTAIFTLSPQKDKTVDIDLWVPYGSTLTVTEDQYPNYTTKVGNTSGNVWTKTNITANVTGNSSVVFTNTEFYPAPTNYTTNYKPFFMMFGFGAILVGLIVPPIIMFRRRREEEE